MEASATMISGQGWGSGPCFARGVQMALSEARDDGEVDELIGQHGARGAAWASGNAVAAAAKRPASGGGLSVVNIQDVGGL